MKVYRMQFLSTIASFLILNVGIIFALYIYRAMIDEGQALGLNPYFVFPLAIFAFCFVLAYLIGRANASVRFIFKK